MEFEKKIASTYIYVEQYICDNISAQKIEHT